MTAKQSEAVPNLADSLADLIADLAQRKGVEHARAASVAAILSDNFPEREPCAVPTPGCYTVWSLREGVLFAIKLRRKDGSEFCVDLYKGPSYLPGDTDPQSLDTPFFKAHIKGGNLEIYAPGEAPKRLTSEYRKALHDGLCMRPSPRDASPEHLNPYVAFLEARLPMLDGRAHAWVVKRLEVIRGAAARHEAGQAQAFAERGVNS
jgi:hypothetical protein